ncbi:MAG TPA: hypothetical protein VGS23_05065 [Thermoplasmata archaeon]|nr:hypothetical protein [Thermoplasmata archaeon]
MVEGTVNANETETPCCPSTSAVTSEPCCDPSTNPLTAKPCCDPSKGCPGGCEDCC